MADEDYPVPTCLPTVACEYDLAKAESGDFSEMTAEQYLSYVRDQAGKMPVVTRVDVDLTQFEGKQTKYMPDLSSIEKCAYSLLPSPDWEETVLEDFRGLREVTTAQSHNMKVALSYCATSADRF